MLKQRLLEPGTSAATCSIVATGSPPKDAMHLAGDFIR